MLRTYSVTQEFSACLSSHPTMTRCPPRITFVVNNRRVTGVFQSRRRRRAYIRRPLSPAEWKRQREASRENTAGIDTAIEEWFQLTMAAARDIGKRFNHQPRWVLDKMFYRGAYVKKQNKTNSWNAWASQMCAKVNAGKRIIQFSFKLALTKNGEREGGDTLSLIDVREQYAAEYAALTPAEKKALVSEYELKKTCPAVPPTRVTARSRVQDFAHTYQQISDLVSDHICST